MSNNEVPRADNGYIVDIFIMSTLRTKHFRTVTLRRGSIRNTNTHPYSAFSLDRVAAVSYMWSLLLKSNTRGKNKGFCSHFSQTSY